MVTPLIVAGLVIAAVWGLYLLPGMFGERRTTPLNSTEEFDRLTRQMADIQRQGYDARVSSARDLVRVRRRRTTAALIVLAIVTAFLAWRQGSLNWLLLHLGIDACLAWYLAMVAQLRQRHAQRVANRYFSQAIRERDDGPVRVISNH
ncbi:MAG TPA: hypothetical protein VLA54_08400 [Acidimicrobiia bacterium]|nr:hypothetical protein [Acidimicrobiia bacterium]